MKHFRPACSPGLRHLTNSLLLTAKGLECIHPSVSFPRIRSDTTLRVRVSVWEADMKILITSPTADEYLRNMLCVYAGPCFAKFDTSHFRQMPQGPLRPFKFLLLALAHTLASSLRSVPMTCAVDHTAWTIQVHHYHNVVLHLRGQKRWNIANFFNGMFVPVGLGCSEILLLSILSPSKSKFNM